MILAEQVGGMEGLKRRAAECGSLSTQLLQASKDNKLLSDQFKKESGLRRSYKNELEDLKGAIRVYARCRPMVSYERERGCKQVTLWGCLPASTPSAASSISRYIIMRTYFHGQYVSPLSSPPSV
jgi:Microtubule binding